MGPHAKLDAGPARGAGMRLAIAALLSLASLAVAVAPSVAAVAPEPVCVPTNGGGLDYYSQACVDAGDLGCPVYHESWTDFGHQKTCVPP